MELDHTPIFFICNDPERALGLELTLPNFHIVSIDDNPMIDYISNAGGKAFSLERASGSRNSIFRNSYKALQHQAVQEYIRKNTPKEAVPHLIFFKIAPNIEKLVDTLGYKLLNTTADLNRKYENKISQFETLQNKITQFPLSRIARFDEVTYSGLSEIFGLPFVIQFDRGHTGSGTIFIHDEMQFNNLQKLFPKREAKFSQKIEGEAWTLNACVTRFGIAYGGLCYQITGTPELTSNEGGTVGNDWSAVGRLSTDSIQQIAKLTERVGEIMQSDGYEGLYGLDLIVDKQGRVFLIEINARQPASTGVHNKILLEKKGIPLQLLHIAQFLTSTNDDFIKFINSSLNFSYDAPALSAQIAKQNLEGLQSFNLSQVVYRNSKREPITIQKGVTPGIFKDNRFIREGYSIEQLRNADEFLILASQPGQIISPGGEIGRILRRGAVVERNSLLPQTSELLKIFL